MKIIPIEELIEERDYYIEVMASLNAKLLTCNEDEKENILNELDIIEDFYLYTCMDINMGRQIIFEEGDPLPF